MSARTLQMDEMKLNLGPAKGKDFSTVIGPWLVTPDELEPYKVSPKAGHTGNTYNLAMKARLNGEEISSGNMADMDWTFAEILERCAYGVDILPGDVIGSGTVGTGCFLELNGTGLRFNPDTFKPRWLKESDVIELEIDGLGVLTNTIRREKSDFSIIAKYRP
jgi:fumarylacetoacetate (FAA) hydrolase